MMTTILRRLVCVAIAAIVLAPTTASAQLDPLLFLKKTTKAGFATSTEPNIILAVETANRMQRDADDTYYDPGAYTETGEAWEAALGLLGSEATKTYRRKFYNLLHSNVNDANEKFTATRIDAVGDQEAGYTTFYERTRLTIARRGLMQAIADNSASARFALVRTRHATFPVPLPAAGNEQPVRIIDTSNITQTSTGDAGINKWKITRHSMSSMNSSQTLSGLLVKADLLNANTSISTILKREVYESGTALRPAGADTITALDAPVGFLLDDARSHANDLIVADANGCRNTVVVLVVGGGEGSVNPQNLQAKAQTFMNVGGRRVPIYVVALFPAADDVAELRDIATASGGEYFEVTEAMVDATTPGQAIAEVVRAVNLAVQHAYVESTKFNTGSTSEFQVTSPIVGTVNLRYASKLTATGTEQLPDEETYILKAGAEVPMRSNVLVTSGFTLPGFDAKVRAFRVYRPEEDPTKPSGYIFKQDGSRLWENSVPASGSRNIFTVLPGSSDLVPFTVARVDDFDDYLNVNDPATLVEYIRALPMGAVVGSTPAFLDVPSLDPPPDADYPAFREENKDRRALIFIGANDGMLHALDARTGVEVWAFIPFNLLPKLKALRYGQSLDAFKYYVDSSPKISDVKVNDEWRTFLFFGQGPGGTFYNTLDVTLEDIDNTIPEDSTNTGAMLTYFSEPSRIRWKWSFPRMTSFDAELSTYGELTPAASAQEHSIGETWSDPAIGQVHNEDGPYVMVVGSGYLKYSVQNTYRTGTRAGTTFYVFDVEDGSLLGSKEVPTDGVSETNDDCRDKNDCRTMKNALQMDPVATGPQDQRFITMVYIGDLDGNVWKFDLAMSADTLTLGGPLKLYTDPLKAPLFASMATVNVGGANQYIFVGTGSDLLPSPDPVNKSQTASLLVLLDTGASATKKAEVLLEKIDGTAGDEKVTTFPAVAGDIVFFTTTTYNVTTPCTPYSANLYAFTFIGGPAYDTNNDGKLSSGTTGSTGGKGGKTNTSTTADSQKVFTTSGERATAPFIVDQHLVFSTGGNIQMFGDPNDFNNGVGQAGVRILSWRAVK